MAKIIPDNAISTTSYNISSGELATLKKLQAKLSKNYTVYHSVNWSRNTRFSEYFNSRFDNGEIDFIILNYSGEIIFIEQKDKTRDWLEEKNGTLIALEKNKRGQIRKRKDVIEQINRNIINVKKEFNSLGHGHGTKINPIPVIYCPRTRVQKLEIKKKDIIIFDSEDKIWNEIRNLLPVKDREKTPKFDKLDQFFRNHYCITPSHTEIIREQDLEFEKTAGFIANILSNFENINRLHINGVAGSGKSLYACKFFEDKSNKGKQVLYVCYNNHLATRMKARLGVKERGENSKIHNFHDLIKCFLEDDDIKKPLDFKQKVDVSEFWVQAFLDFDETLRNIDKVPDNWQFDSIIIDEGQDIEAEWYESLKYLLRDKDKGDILWLEDPDQNIRGVSNKEGIKFEDFVRYSCRDNFRTPKKIAEYILKNTESRFTCRNNSDGYQVKKDYYVDDKDQVEIVSKLLDKLTSKNEFKREQITILTCRGYESSIFYKKDKVGRYKLSKVKERIDQDTKIAEPEYDHAGNLKYSDGDIFYNSVNKYKGDESPVVILVDIDQDKIKEKVLASVLLCGMTRATLKLHLLVKKN